MKKIQKNLGLYVNIFPCKMKLSLTVALILPFVLGP